MVNRYMKRFPTLLITRKIQIKTKMRYHILARMAITQSQKLTCIKDVVRQNCECLLWRYRAAVDCHRDRGSGCIRLGYGISLLGEDHH